MRVSRSYFLGLVQTHARSAGDADRYRQLIAELTERLTAAEEEVRACALLIRSVNEGVDLARIQPIRGPRRYGKHGELRAAICEYLAARPQAEVSTTELSLVLQAKFSLDFATPVERKRWVNNSLASALKALVRSGKVGRCHDRRPSGTVGRWCWRNASESVDAMMTLAVANGVPVVQADAEDD